MPVLLPNVLLATSRMVASGSPPSSTLQPWLSNVSAHISPVSAHDLAILPDGAGMVKYRATVASGTDIQVGDIVTSITRPLNPAQSWPAPSSPNAVFVVAMAMESAPSILATRSLYLTESVTGGPVAF
jgi:hypothetical protein